MAAHATRPWDWSHVDCCMAIADLSIAYGTDDPAADLRGSYGSEAECFAVMEAASGLPAFFDRLGRVGWRRVYTPSEGCVAAVGSPTVPTRQWGAVRHGQRWNVRLAHGWVPFTARPLVIWEI